MPNAIERLFDSISPQLKKSVEPDWPDSPFITDRTSNHAVFGSEDAGIVSVDDEETKWDVDDRMDGRPNFTKFDEAERETIEGGIRSRGFDALAFYKSRRFLALAPFPGKWGIFYLEPGLRYVASQIALAYPGFGDPRRLALDFLRAHERFHFAADVQTLMFEATLKRQLYLPLRRALQTQPSIFVEEALANRQAWLWSKKPGVGLEEFAFDFMKCQPDAYERFDEPRLELAAEWAAITVDFARPGTSKRWDLAHWVESAPRGLMRASLCPEYVIYPDKLSGWFSLAEVLPPVKAILDSAPLTKLFASRFGHLETQWERTKAKLLENRLLAGLNFKRWPPDGSGAYSVRIDRNFRAHLRHEGEGQWVAYAFGPHGQMGHG
jgi:hypothetical protein